MKKKKVVAIENGAYLIRVERKSPYLLTGIMSNYLGSCEDGYVSYTNIDMYKKLPKWLNEK